MVAKLAGRVRKPVAMSCLPGRGPDRAEDVEPAGHPVPVSGVALPDRATDEAGTPAGSGVRVGSANDPAEAEADATARSIVEVLRTVNPVADAGHDLSGAPEQGDTVRRAALVGAEGGQLDATTADAIDRLRGTGRPLPAPVRRSMEAAFGTDLSDVRVHTGGTAARLNQALQSRAFTAGRDIAFADGLPDTATAAGQHLLAHELTHVVQNHGPAPIRRTLRQKGAKLDTSWDDLEQDPEMDEAGAAATLVIRFWADSKKQVPYTTVSALIKKAGTELPNLPAAFADSLRDLTEVNAIEKSFARRKKPVDDDLREAVTERREELQALLGGQIDRTKTLPAPDHDDDYRTPTKLFDTVAKDRGRDDGKFAPTQNTVIGAAGKKTASVNHALIKASLSSGAMQMIDGDYMEFCATCGQVTHATNFEVDHQQAFSDIRDRLRQLAVAMSQDQQLYDDISGSTGHFEDIFQVTGTPGSIDFEVEALASGMHIYSNDLGNLMRICRRCNGPWGKSDMEMTQWYLKSPLYGQDFLDEYQLPGNTFQVIARTKNDLGWGVAAREWFTKHHLPVLKQQELTAKIQKSVQQRLIVQSNSGVKAKLSKDPQERQKFQVETEQHDRNNKGYLGGLRSVHDYHSGSKGKVSKFSPGSPQRIEKEYDEVHQRREKRKRTETLKDNKAYSVGQQDGRVDKPAHRGDYSASTEDQEAYDQGFQAGKDEYQADERAGVLDALDWDLSLKDPDADANHSFQFNWARDQMLAQRRKAWQAGSDAFGQDGPDVGYATGQAHSERLLRDYLAGYRAAQQQAKRQQARNQSSQPSQNNSTSTQQLLPNRPTGLGGPVSHHQVTPQHQPMQTDQVDQQFQQGFQFQAPMPVRSLPSVVPSLRHDPQQGRPPQQPFSFSFGNQPHSTPVQHQRVTPPQQQVPQHGQYQRVTPPHQLAPQHGQYQVPQHGNPHDQQLQALRSQYQLLQQQQQLRAGPLPTPRTQNPQQYGNNVQQYGQGMQQYGQQVQQFGNNVLQFGQNLQQDGNQQPQNQQSPWDWLLQQPRY